MKTIFHFYVDNIDGRHWNHAIRPNLVLIGMCLHGMEYRSERRRKCDGDIRRVKGLTLKQAVIVAAIFEFAGAFFAGDAVTDTVRKGILVVDFETVTEVFANDLMYGFILL